MLAFGQAEFSAASKTIRYFQLFQKEPTAPVEGETALWFSRKIDDEEYEMECFDTPNITRPLLFRHLITVMNSLPDELQDQESMESLRQGMAGFLETVGEHSWA
ncbi:MAG: hypothetical protein HQM14_07825 [SAR324 cluster bacterium]|nr:hypothetical protein [SAR324 cluster bacterium]